MCILLTLAQAQPSAPAMPPETQSPAPDEYFLGVRVFKTPDAGTLTWSVELPQDQGPCRLVQNKFTSGENTKEFYFHILAASTLSPPSPGTLAGVRIKVDPSKVRGVLVGRSHVPFEKTTDGIVFDIPRDSPTVSSLDTIATLHDWLPGDVTDHHSFIHTPGIETRIEHGVRERQNGPYAKKTWPAVELHAALNLEFAACEGITGLKLNRTVLAKGLGAIELMGFDTAFPTVSPESAHAATSILHPTGC